jgi:hypothetical protein
LLESDALLHWGAILKVREILEQTSYRRLGRPQGRSGQVLKISPPPGFDPRIFQLVVSRYTDYAIPAHKIVMNMFHNTETINAEKIQA